MFNINWEHTCYECKCPLDIVCTLQEDSIKIFFRDFTTWGYLNPFSVADNNSIYKFYGNILHRICLSCYHNPIRINIHKREIGQSCKIKTVKYSKTCSEIYNYFERFQRFRQRKDLLDITEEIDEDRRKYVDGLQLLWRHPRLHALFEIV